MDPIDNVFVYHEVADFLLASSRSEGFPYSVLEMLSLGKKCVLSDIPGHMWASEFKSVEMFKSEDVKACSNAIETLLEHLDDVSDEYLLVNEKYSIEKWVDCVIKNYG